MADLVLTITIPEADSVKANMLTAFTDEQGIKDAIREKLSGEYHQSRLAIRADEYTDPMDAINTESDDDMATVTIL